MIDDKIRLTVLRGQFCAKKCFFRAACSSKATGADCLVHDFVKYAKGEVSVNKPE